MASFRILGAVAAAALLAAPVMAIAGPDDSMSLQNMPAAGQPTGAMNDPSMAPSAGRDATDTSGTVVSGSQISPYQAGALQNGDNRTVTNGPVPDTAANRAMYGAPMSNAGKRTAPAGN